MPEILIIELNPVTVEQYNQVNEILGVNPTTGEGDWPEGLISHLGGATATGGISVVEVWESQAAQGAFMASRLGPALGQAGVPEPSRIEWLTLVGRHDL